VTSAAADPPSDLGDSDAPMPSETPIGFTELIDLAKGARRWTAAAIICKPSLSVCAVDNSPADVRRPELDEVAAVVGRRS
jgi:hypothetical protein